MQLTEDHVVSSLRRTWQPVANAAALPPGKIIGYTLLETRLVVARFADGRLLAADADCPHKGADLAKGCLKNDHLMCPYHGWEFAADGECRSIPSLLEPNPEKLALSHLRTYAIQERYGFVWVKLDREALADGRAHELPLVPEFEDAAWTYVMGPPMAFAAGWRREVENYLDMTHFAFAHASSLGICADPRIRDMKITVYPDVGYQMDAPFPALDTPHELQGKLQSAHHRMCELQHPREIPINPGRGGWGVLVTPGDTLANTFQKQLRRWLLEQAGARDPVSS